MAMFFPLSLTREIALHKNADKTIRVKMKNNQIHQKNK